MNSRMQQAEEAVNQQVQALAEQRGEPVAQEQPQVVEPELAPQEQAAEGIEISSESFDPYAEQEVPAEAPGEPQGQEDFEHKYRVLQGMYRKEVADVREDNRRLSSQLAELNSIILGLRAKVEELQEAPKEVAELDDVDLEAFADYGTEIQDLAKSNALLKKELRELRSQTGQIQELQDKVNRTVDSGFERELDALLPTWRTQDKDPQFIAWLNNLSPATGQPWLDALRGAYQARDAARTVAIFKEYRTHLFLLKQGQDGGPARPKRQPTPAPASRGGSQDVASAPQYTLEDWTTLQTDAARGVWNNDPEGYKKKEAEIHAALFPKRGKR